MKFVRKFPDTETRDEVLAIVDYEVLSYTEGAGINIKVGESEPVIDYSIPFYIEDISGSENTLSIKKSGKASPTLTIEKSIDCINWNSMGTTSTTAITATIPANGKLYLRCSADSWSTVGGYYVNWNQIDITGNCKVGGNIMSLVYGSSFTGDEIIPPSTSGYAFMDLFRNNLYLINASELILPVITLTNYCYSSMFAGCTSLTTAPALPATILAQNCYSAMFSGCTSLTTAPELPAAISADLCYSSMFYGCTNLNYIKCLATDISASNCTNNWVDGVPSTGTFVKAASMSGWTEGISGIPQGWTVQNAA